MKLSKALPVWSLAAPVAGLALLAGSLLGLGGWYTLFMAAGLMASVLAAEKGLEATAVAVALHAHLLGNKGLPEPRPLPDALATAIPGPAGQQAQWRAARLLATIWPPLSPSGVESPRLHEILSREAPFADIRLQKVLGIIPASLEKQTAAVLSRMPPGSPELALGGQPPKLRLAGLGDVATGHHDEGIRGQCTAPQPERFTHDALDAIAIVRLRHAALRHGDA